MRDRHLFSAAPLDRALTDLKQRGRGGAPVVEGGFPESAWESRLFAEYRELVGPTAEAPDAFLWGALAGALSFLIGQDARYPWGAGFQPPTLLVALVGTTGKARKSTAIDDVLHIVVEPLRARGDAAAGEPDPTGCRRRLGLR